MSRFNKPGLKATVTSPLDATGPETVNHYGASAGTRDPRAELFLMAVSFMGGDSNYYETSDARYQRLVKLTRELAVLHGKWMGDMINWVRNSAQMRTVAGVMAVEAVMARLEFAKTQDEKYRTTQGTTNRELIDAACSRADEPGEILAYYLSKYPKPIPFPIEQGLGDAVRRLYTERSFLRYGSESTKAITMKDVLRLVHPKADREKQEQDALFNYIVGKSEVADPVMLPKIAARNKLMAVPQEERREHLRTRFQFKGNVLRDAEMGWEQISAWLNGMDKEAWEAVIPNMGLMALLRNLRNFDKVEISDSFAQKHIMLKLFNPEEIRKARVLPMRFLSAYKNAPSLRWSYPLEMGLNASLANVPEIGGRNLILVDVSPSMTWEKISEKSDLTYYDAACIFGAVMAVRNPGSDLAMFGGHSKAVPVKRGESVLKVIEKFHGISYTNIPQALGEQYNGHDRVIIVTDEQSSGYGSFYGVPDAFTESMNTIRGALHSEVPLYVWNLAGYKAGINWPNTHVFGGGFSDAAFGMIKVLESGRNGRWPWELQAASQAASPA